MSGKIPRKMEEWIDGEILKLVSERISSPERMDKDSFIEQGKALGLDADLCSSLATLLSSKRKTVIRTYFPKDVSIIGGSGKMGKWMSDFLTESGNRVQIIDPASGNGLTIDDCKNSDIVIVSVPIHATEGILKKLDTVCKKNALIFDLASLKSTITDTLRSMAKHRNVCSIHPMFGPSASSLSGRNLIVCDCGNTEAAKEASSLFEGRGGNIRMMDIAEHDVYMSYVLGLSHAVNIAFFTVLDRSGIPMSDMASVASTTFRKNLETNASVALEDPELYYEIQHLNCHREEMWDLFSRAVADIKDASMSNDPSAFISIMEKGRNYFMVKE